MPSMTSLDAFAPDAWAYRTLMRREAPVSAGPQTAPGMPQTAYAAAQGQPPVTTQPVGTPSPLQPQSTMPAVTPQAAAPTQVVKPATGSTATGRQIIDPSDPVIGGGVTQQPTTQTQTQYGTTPRTDMGSGTGGGYNYSGFDFNQDAGNRLIGKSAKYTFADATREAEAAGAGDVWKTKEGAQYFAERYIKPKLEAAGVEVLDIKGDKMLLRDWQDRAEGKPGRWVDFVINAGGDNPALGWQVDNSIDAMAATERKYSSREDAGTNPYTTPAGSTTAPGQEADPNAPGTDPGESEDGKRALLARARTNRMMAALG